MSSNFTLFDFTTIKNLDSWVESSDTVRDVGMSKASFVLQRTQRYQRSIFFVLLNPQPDGACFAGYRTPTYFNSSDYAAIQIRLRGARGEIWRYKIVLSNQILSYQRTYEAYFNVTDTSDRKDVQDFYKYQLDITLPLNGFTAMYRGKPDTNAPPLNSSNVVSLGIQAAGGVYEKEKQSGVGAIEIDWLKLLQY